MDDAILEINIPGVQTYKKMMMIVYGFSGVKLCYSRNRNRKAQTGLVCM